MKTIIKQIAFIILMYPAIIAALIVSVPKAYLSFFWHMTCGYSDSIVTKLHKWGQEVVKPKDNE